MWLKTLQHKKVFKLPTVIDNILIYKTYTIKFVTILASLNFWAFLEIEVKCTTHMFLPSTKHYFMA